MKALRQDQSRRSRGEPSDDVSSHDCIGFDTSAKSSSSCFLMGNDASLRGEASSNSNSSFGEYHASLNDASGGTTRFGAHDDGNEPEISMPFVPPTPKSRGAVDSSTENFLDGIAFIAPDQVTVVKNLMDRR